MLLRFLVKDRDKRKRYAHIGAGIVILVHAYEKYETGHGPFALFLIAGLTFLTIALFHHLLENRLPWIDGVFFIIEGLLSFAVAVDYFLAGKKALPMCYLLLGILQFFMALRRSKKGIEHHKSKIQV